jgi:TonB family protein
VEGAVDLTFLISAEGKIIDPRVVVPSAHQWLNEESLAMLDRIESLPPPPDGIAVPFPVRIEYRLESIASPISTEGAYP